MRASVEGDSSQRYYTPRQQTSPYGRLTLRSSHWHTVDSMQTALLSASPSFVAKRAVALNAYPERLHFLAGLRVIPPCDPIPREIRWLITQPNGQLRVSLRSAPPAGPLPVFGVPHQLCSPLLRFPLDIVRPWFAVWSGPASIRSGTMH